MNKILILFSILSCIYSEQKILWDLGIIINPENENNRSNMIKPLISDTKILPQYKKENKSFISDITKSNIPYNHIVKLLYLSDRYVELVAYIEAHPESSYSDETLYIYSDALYRLGHYNKAITIIESITNNYPNDTKKFLLALYNKKLGNKQAEQEILKKLISEHPNSEYVKLAKLQLGNLK
tara:strand:- start:385 stop:930 length:546 start_codon:yes stop_codon:yes gene_type:complete